MKELNIIEIIEKNPIVTLSDNCNTKLLIKIKENFTSFEQHLFINNFYCYLNYDYTNDFVVDVDNIWKWLGFVSKYNLIRILEKFFIKNIDYKDFSLCSKEKQEIGNKGGHNIIKIMLNIKCFKAVCLKSHTKKASEIHEYYLHLETILLETLKEDSQDFAKALSKKEALLEEKDRIIENATKAKQQEVEKAIISQFPVNTECIYIGTIDNTNESNEKLIKFGHSNDLCARVSYHHCNSYKNFVLIYAFKVNNRTEIENLIKNSPKIKKQIRKITIDGKNKTEIIAYDENFTIEKIIFYIKDIIKSRVYSTENFNRIINENERLKTELNELRENNTTQTEKINNQALEIIKLNQIIHNQNLSIQTVIIEDQTVFKLPEEDELTLKFNNFINKMCIIRSDVEESSVNIEGQFRIWNKEKPKKEVFHALKSYLDARFKPIRITQQDKNQVVYGYEGVKLKEIIYTKKYANPIPVETFLFHICKFAPYGKILNSTLLLEYKKWKQSLMIEENPDDMKELKEYLNKSEYVIKSTVWTSEGSNEGYYGIMLESEENVHRRTSSTGKNIEKRDIKTNHLIAKWETIAKAAISENMSASKMSRYVKRKIQCGDVYYCTPSS
jgi:hypothetical protein